MSEGREPIRSYQRIFRPERRIHQIEGRALPVPGGVPLRWLGYVTAALLAVLAIGSRSPMIAALVVLGAGGCGILLGGAVAALIAGVGAGASFEVTGFVLGLLDWPLRLVVLPVAVATLATQATPDGRRADRFAAAWIALRLSPRRRSLGRAMPPVGAPQSYGRSFCVAPDQHTPRLRAGRVRGDGMIDFAAEVGVRRGRLCQRCLIVRPWTGRPRRSEVQTRRLSVGAGEVLEVRP